MTRPIALLILLAVAQPADAFGRGRRAAQPYRGGCPTCAAATTSETRTPPVTTSAATFDPSGYLAEINRVRSQHGLASLGWSDAAYGHASRNAGIVAAVRSRLWHPGGGGYEIAARNQTDIADACRSWLNSPGHRRILLGGQFRSAGIAMVIGVDGQPVWFAQFE